VWLDSTKSVVVAMVIHELATNAVKYENGQGCVSVSWEQQLLQPNLVRLVWQENGGPEVRSPQRKGFGSHLIERAFRGQLGTAQLLFSPQGLCCLLEIDAHRAGGHSNS
jgi:two-component sensor histidine kinase